jgi:hypothetical protein
MKSILLMYEIIKLHIFLFLYFISLSIKPNFLLFSFCQSSFLNKEKFLKQISKFKFCEKMNRFKFKKDFKKLKNFLNLEFFHFFFVIFLFLVQKKRFQKK